MLLHMYRSGNPNTIYFSLIFQPSYRYQKSETSQIKANYILLINLKVIEGRVSLNNIKNDQKV